MTEKREMWICPNCSYTEPLEDVDGHCPGCGEFDVNGPFDLREPDGVDDPQYDGHRQ
jgi:predicted ATP-dependent serine protease